MGDMEGGSLVGVLKDLQGSTGRSIKVLVGPEGGFTDEEMNFMKGKVYISYLYFITYMSDQSGKFTVCIAESK
jgi:hypothetical protein